MDDLEKLDDLEKRVRDRAYKLWQEEGCPEGRADVHWDKARELVAIEENMDLTLVPVPGPDKLGPYGDRSNRSRLRKTPAKRQLWSIRARKKRFLTGAWALPICKTESKGRPGSNWPDGLAVVVPACFWPVPYLRNSQI